MKIDDYDFTKWWHWLVAVIIFALLVFLALLLAQGIVCWANQQANNRQCNTTITSSLDYPAETSSKQSDNSTVIIIFNPPYHPMAIDIPSNSENITISWPSDNCTLSG